MKSRERVMLTLSHQEPDRIPIDLGATIVSSIAKNAYVELKNYLGIPLEPVRLLDHIQQLPYIDEVLLDLFGVDLRMICLPPAAAPTPDIFEEGGNYAFVDRWGSKLHMPKEGGLYFDWVDFAIQESTMSALENYDLPQPDPPEYTARLCQQAQYLFEKTDYALVGSAIFGGGIFEQALRIRGMQNFLMALLDEPEFADRLMERVTDVYVESCNNYLDALGEYLHVFLYFDDVCGQDGWLISPDLYRKMIKPKQRRLVEAVKQKTNARVFYHGCGAVYALIPDLIEIGIDIINPVQVSARGMDTRQLKKEFGKDIVFWGGGVDTQHVLPFGKPEQVADEVRRRIDDLAPGGGFVFAAVHNIQSFVPPQNIVTAFQTALEYGNYGRPP